MLCMPPSFNIRGNDRSTPLHCPPDVRGRAEQIHVTATSDLVSDLLQLERTNPVRMDGPSITTMGLERTILSPPRLTELCQLPPQLLCPATLRALYLHLNKAYCHVCHLARLYVPETTSLGKTRVIVTLLWCSGLLCIALGCLVGFRHHDTYTVF